MPKICQQLRFIITGDDCEGANDAQFNFYYCCKNALAWVAAVCRGWKAIRALRILSPSSDMFIIIHLFTIVSGLIAGITISIQLFCMLWLLMSVYLLIYFYPSLCCVFVGRERVCFLLFVSKIWYLSLFLRGSDLNEWQSAMRRELVDDLMVCFSKKIWWKKQKKHQRRMLKIKNLINLSRFEPRLSHS